MQVSSRWRTATLLAGALIAGTIIGPPLAQAAGAGLIRLEGGGSTHVAKVSSSGQLSVNTGLSTTPTGQAEVAPASPGSVVTVFSYPTCGSGGAYTVPAGKALIITAMDFFNWNAGTGKHQLVAYIGPANDPCSGTIVAASIGIDDGNSSQNQVYPSGIVVPSGDAVGLLSYNDTGSADLYGYLVPASAVPKAARNNLIGAAASRRGTGAR